MDLLVLPVMRGKAGPAGRLGTRRGLLDSLPVVFAVSSHSWTWHTSYDGRKCKRRRSRWAAVSEAVTFADKADNWKWDFSFAELTQQLCCPKTKTKNDVCAKTYVRSVMRYCTIPPSKIGRSFSFGTLLLDFENQWRWFFSPKIREFWDGPWGKLTNIKFANTFTNNPPPPPKPIFKATQNYWLIHMCLIHPTIGDPLTIYNQIEGPDLKFSGIRKREQFFTLFKVTAVIYNIIRKSIWWALSSKPLFSFDKNHY